MNQQQGIVYKSELTTEVRSAFNEYRKLKSIAGADQRKVNHAFYLFSKACYEIGHKDCLKVYQSLLNL